MPGAGIWRHGPWADEDDASTSDTLERGTGEGSGPGMQQACAERRTLEAWAREGCGLCIEERHSREGHRTPAPGARLWSGLQESCARRRNMEAWAMAG